MKKTLRLLVFALPMLCMALATTAIYSVPAVAGESCQGCHAQMHVASTMVTHAPAGIMQPALPNGDGNRIASAISPHVLIGMHVAFMGAGSGFSVLHRSSINHDFLKTSGDAHMPLKPSVASMRTLKIPWA